MRPGKPRSKMFARFDEAHTDAKSKAVSFSNGELDVCPWGDAERITSVEAVEVVSPTGQSGSLVAGQRSWSGGGVRISVRFPPAPC